MENLDPVSEHRDEADSEDTRDTAEDRHRRSSIDERHELGDARGPGELAAVFNSRASAFMERSKARETAVSFVNNDEATRVGGWKKYEEPLLVLQA